MAETKESAMEDENNVTSKVTSDAGTEAEPQEVLVPKRGKQNSIILPSRCSKHWQFTLSSSCWLASGLSCHVIVRSRLSLFQGVTGCCCHCLLVRRQCGVQYLAGANPSFVSGRGQGTPWTSCQLIASCTRWATAAPGLWIITVKWMSISLDMVFRLFSWGWCAISKARLGHQMV